MEKILKSDWLGTGLVGPAVSPSEIIASTTCDSSVAIDGLSSDNLRREFNSVSRD